jgi:hypothetical protein
MVTGKNYLILKDRGKAGESFDDVISDARKIE